MSALLPLNWQRVSSSEDNSVLLILCISAGELNHLPAFFTCHLIDEANPALCGKLSVDAHINSQSAGWLISFSLDDIVLSSRICAMNQQFGFILVVISVIFVSSRNRDVHGKTQLPFSRSVS